MRNLKLGDRVLIPSSIACGFCSYCRAGCHSQCDNANPNGPKAGSLSIVGFYPETARFFPIGKAMGKNLTVKAGNCNHRRYIPRLLGMIRSGVVHPEKILTRHEPMANALEAYHAFDRKETGWIKVELEPSLT